MKKYMTVVCFVLVLGFGMVAIDRVLAQPALMMPEPAPAADNGQPHGASFLSKLKSLFYPAPPPPSQQDQAAMLARQGHYDEALAILDALSQKDPTNLGVMRDRVAVLSWAGRDAEAVALYQTLPPQRNADPDYVLAALGHSYRALGQTDQALAIYSEGLRQYPASVVFADGKLRCLIDEDKIEEAEAKTGDNLKKYGNRPEIVAIQNDIRQIIIKKDDQSAVELGRAGRYDEAIAMLASLYMQDRNNPAIVRDYLAVLDWAGGHDDQVAALYKSLPPGPEPDYVLEAAGHAYRQLHRPDQALLIYETGLNEYPDRVVFTEGQIRSMADEGKFDEALAMANEDLRKHGRRPEIVDIKKNVMRLKREAHLHRKRHSHDMTQARY